MSIEGLENLIKKAESIDNDQAEEVKKCDPNYQTSDDIKADCRKRAEWLIGKYHIAATLVKPEAATLVLTDPEIKIGIDNLTDVLEKYPVKGELPTWLVKLLSYEEIFICGAWFGGSMFKIYQVDQNIKAEVETDNENEESNKNGE